jgi:predicted DNA-binding antitoxin AbrB/MazE fold protein
VTTTVDAIYEDGKLTLTQPLPLPPHSHVQVTIETPADELLDVERRNRIWSELDNDTEGW